MWLRAQFKQKGQNFWRPPKKQYFYVGTGLCQLHIFRLAPIVASTKNTVRRIPGPEPMAIGLNFLLKFCSSSATVTSWMRLKAGVALSTF